MLDFIEKGISFAATQMAEVCILVCLVQEAAAKAEQELQERQSILAASQAEASGHAAEVWAALLSILQHFPLGVCIIFSISPRSVLHSSPCDGKIICNADAGSSFLLLSCIQSCREIHGPPFSETSEWALMLTKPLQCRSNSNEVWYRISDHKDY